MSETNACLAESQYAVVFRTHFWDDFTDRQFKRLRARVGNGHLFVLVDETRGPVSGIPTANVFGLTDGDILAAGYVRAGEGSIQWYSGDVPLYLFSEAHPEYKYYVQIEYDAIVNVDLDELIDKVMAGNADVVALREDGEDSAWHWRATCLGFYSPDEVTHLLICFSVYSARALKMLSTKRLEHAERFKSGAVTEWPMCEGFISSEANRLGLVIKSLSEFGDVDAYRWWPPYCETEAKHLDKHAFVHPVLESSRFVPSVLRNGFKPSISQLLLPSSWVHKLLRNLGPLGYVRALLSKPYRASLMLAFHERYSAGDRS